LYAFRRLLGWLDLNARSTNQSINQSPLSTEAQTTNHQTHRRMSGAMDHHPDPIQHPPPGAPACAAASGLSGHGADGVSSLHHAHHPRLLLLLLLLLPPLREPAGSQ